MPVPLNQVRFFYIVPMNSVLQKVERFIKDWTLLIAIVLGVSFHKFFGYISNNLPLLLPILIFIMLFLSFSKLEKFSTSKIGWHLLLALIQFVVGIGLYYIVLPYDPILAAGVSICVLVSPATSSPVVVNLMKGNINFSTEFLLFNSVIVAIFLPFWLGHIGNNNSLDLLQSIKEISLHTLVVVLVPLAISIILRKAVPESKKVIARVSFLSYYLWAFALMVIMGASADLFLSDPNADYKFAIESLMLTTFTCFCLIMGGKLLGGDKGSGIAAGQALGQKNTVLAIWLASGFLDPMSAIVPTMWIISQNIINSVQLWNVHRIHK